MDGIQESTVALQDGAPVVRILELCADRCDLRIIGASQCFSRVHRGHSQSLNRVWTALFVSNANDVVDLRFEYLPVADLPCLSSLDDGVNGCVNHFVLHHDLELHLGKEIYAVFTPSIKLGVSLLATVPAHFDDSH